MISFGIVITTLYFFMIKFILQIKKAKKKKMQDSNNDFINV